ncbi:MAG: GntR family transcriptional regulator [Paracoccaceae bacterium]
MSDAGDRHDRLHAELRDRICLLDYAPGARLSEHALAREFGTSRTPLRRVLARLEDEGLVRSVHGVGTLVTDVTLDEMVQTYALRLELAQLVGLLSPRPMTAALLAEMRGLKARGDGLVLAPDARAFARLNMDFFHFGLSLTDNEALREVSERLYYRTARIWLKSIPRMDLADEVARFDRELSETLCALEAGDTAAAALIRRAHISMSVARLRAA